MPVIVLKDSRANLHNDKSELAGPRRHRLEIPSSSSLGSGPQHPVIPSTGNQEAAFRT